MDIINIHTTILFFSCIIFAWVATRFTLFLAPKIGAVDTPDARKVHQKPMPRIGGLAIFTAWSLGILYLFVSHTTPIDSKWIFYIVGAIATFALGFYDDLKILSAKTKFIVQGGIALLLVSQGVIFDMQFLPYFNIELPWIILAIITFFWMVGVINAVNLIDGLDGLAAGITLIALSALSLIAILHQEWLWFLMALPLIASLIGFLPWNKNPAKTFMGDCGSLFLGYNLAVLIVLQKSWTLSESGLFIPLVIMGIPIFDTIFSIIRRVLVYKSPFAPDKDHLHHNLIQNGLSHARTVKQLWSISALLGFVAVLMSLSGQRQQIGLFLVVILLAYWGIRRLGYLRRILSFRHFSHTEKHQEDYINHNWNNRSLLTKTRELLQSKLFLVSADLGAVPFIWILSSLWLGQTPKIFLITGVLVHLFFILITMHHWKCYSDLTRYIEFATSGKYIKASIFAGTLTFILLPLLPYGGELSIRTASAITLLHLLWVLTLRLPQNFYFKFLKREITRDKEGPRVFIYGAGDSGYTLLNWATENDLVKWKILGFVDDDIRKLGRTISDYKVRGTSKDLDLIMEKYPFEKLIISPTMISMDQLHYLEETSARLGFQILRLKTELVSASIG